jgi:hypothetical protein
MHTRNFYVGIDTLEPGVLEGQHHRGGPEKNLLTD